jgi:hypothetical protein
MEGELSDFINIKVKVHNISNFNIKVKVHNISNFVFKIEKKQRWYIWSTKRSEKKAESNGVRFYFSKL